MVSPHLSEPRVRDRRLEQDRHLAGGPAGPTCAEVYATTGYGSSLRTFPQVSLTGDNVFGEGGGAQQLGTVSGSIAAGLTVALTVPVASA